MTNDELIAISNGVDTYMSTLMHVYEITPLSLTAILLARCMVLNKQTGSVEDFLKLVNTIVQDPPMEIQRKVH
jgi:hypothetical protein